MIYFVQIGADGPIKIGFTSASSPVELAQDDDRSLNSYLVQLLKKHAERNEKDDQGIPL